ncbi:hypothetical protein GAB14E_0576 [Colwellia psychrerythraea]|uniref:Outer membrane protein beta-barrel domain-containing protein n=2 Tax=Colwellia psychrerythraea TaxID=28229 RepID=A0A099KLT6_COLPS|nr:hypothetical protein GAB14E_0576 [Colwellia psychrerythraea]
MILVFSTASMAENSENISVGFGLDHGFLGGKYAINRDKNKYYAALGVLSYSSESGIGLGYGLGWERLIFESNHSAGLFLGTVAATLKSESAITYYGMSANYNYYFSGYSNSSFVLGASVYSGVTSEDVYDKNTSGLLIKIAYQW